MGPWRREFVRSMRRPMRRLRPVWTGPGPALRIPPVLITLSVALVVAGSMIALLENRLRMGEIASAVGFSNQSYFNRMFRKSCGVSPAEYRRQCSEEKGL